MKTTGIIAVSSFALARLAAAVPILSGQYDIFYSTTTEEVWETAWTTTTVWVNPEVPAATATATSVAAFFEQPKPFFSTFSTSTKPNVAVVSSPEAVAPVATSTPKASPTTTTPVAVAPTPTTTSVYVAPAPTTTEAPAVVVRSTSAVPVPTTTAAAAGSGSGGGSGDHTGDMTYYDVEVGLGSCGLPGKNSEALVALAPADMANGANPNANPHCGKKINIYYNGAVKTATVHDTCPGCATGSIDVTDTLFTAVAPYGDGRVKGVSWSFA